ncbi:NUDIX hydrolase [Pirellula staleyi DSM 6068]|uniref:8-oxo-dGTP diphosphatase n=1 Tax=Pirellula staleyi (strain ATCC 27377 / DSM 6068 / ICPB 4128) TaxID=530564 RepID=D2R4Q7_PIRSD|nr:(deoxy)nucleoside triphosphate pyrophosphohydrolase [Pirellula staleyi]ADB17123.1 NUDIX hydrolase [Pirellula staleyi DSM 6068]
MADNRPQVVVAVAVVRSGDRFLIGQRPPGSKLAGLWEFPGGKVEPGESAADAAIRECLEETNLAVRIVAPLPGRRQTYDHATIELHFFDCEPLDPSQPAADGYRWVERSQLNSYEFPAGNSELLAHLTRP